MAGEVIPNMLRICGGAAALNCCMPMPRIAIVGRPNVGKSSLLNMLARNKVSIVDDTAGTTRDRVSIITDLAPPNQPDGAPESISIEVTDTGGFGVYVVEGRRFDDVGADLTKLTDDIEFQINQAVTGADIVLFVIDAQAGLTAHDETIARLLRERVLGKRRTPKSAAQHRRGDGPTLGEHSEAAAHAASAQSETEAKAAQHEVRVIVVANKCDGPRWEAHAYEAAAMGFGEPMPVSAKNNYFRRDFLDRLYEEVRTIPGVTIGRRRDNLAETGVRLAIIGKRNAGKSSLVNSLAGQDRVIVSEIAGTTRDAVDVRFEMDGKVFTAIDTAGLRKKKSFADRIEWWAFDRAARAVERADVVLLLIDATLPPSQVDQQLAMMVSKSYKPAVIVVNKWDLVQGRAATAGKHKGEAVEPEMYEEYLRSELKGLSIAPIAFISAKNKSNLRDMVRLALDIHGQAGLRVGTGKLNRVLRDIMNTRGPTSKLGTFAKIYFAAQVRGNPPTIVMVVNRPELFTPNYMRFLLGAMRKQLPFTEVPVNIIIKQRERARMTDLQAADDASLMAAAGISEVDDEKAAAAAFAELGIDPSDAMALGEQDVSKYFSDDEEGVSEVDGSFDELEGEEADDGGPIFRDVPSPSRESADEDGDSDFDVEIEEPDAEDVDARAGKEPESVEVVKPSKGAPKRRAADGKKTAKKKPAAKSAPAKTQKSSSPPKAKSPKAKAGKAGSAKVTSKAASKGTAKSASTAKARAGTKGVATKSATKPRTAKKTQTRSTTKTKGR